MSYRNGSVSTSILSSPNGSRWPGTYRLGILALLAGAIGLFGEAQAYGLRICKPTLSVTDVQFSAMRSPTLERKWIAVISVDASRCMTTSGAFEIGISRLKENAIDSDFQTKFIWHPNTVKVSIDFWADEAVEAYWLNIAPCPCRD